MHTAFDVATVLDWKQLPFQIESIDTYGSRLLVGTTRGQLLVYDVKPEGDAKYEIELLDTKKSFAKKAVVQLHVVKELNLLLSLSDNCIQVHDLTTLTLRKVIEKSKGCTSFSADLQVIRDPSADTHRLSPARKCAWQELVLRLAVVFKKKIVTFSWNGSDFLEQKELALPDTPRVVIWCGAALLLGYKREYDIIEEDSLNVTKVFNTGEKQPDAVGIRILGNQLLLNRDNVSYFTDLTGKPARDYGISWSDVPLSIDVAEPFVIAVLPKALEVRSLDKGTLVQQTGDIRGRFLASDSLILVASDVFCWGLKPIPLDVQIDELMIKRDFEEALFLSGRISDSDPKKATRVMDIKKAYAYSEFEKKHYKNAMATYAKLDVSPMEVIGLLPFLVPDQAVPARPAPDQSDQENAVSALVEYLTQRRTELSRKADDDLRRKYLETIDTTLLRCYLQFKQAMVGPLLRLQPNYCNVEESEKLLKNADKLSELVLLYKNRAMHRAALELLQRNASRPGPLNGIAPTVEYLQKLGPENLDLILDFSKWVLTTNPKEGLAIFIDDNAQHGPQLPRDRVLAHLQSCAPQLVVPYLEFIIKAWEELGPDFHNQLALSYLDRVLKAGVQEQGRERQQLLEFLTNSKSYKPETMLTRFMHIDGLYEERAVLLGRLGRHEKALELYAIRLHSPGKAEAYCASHFASDPTVYLSLLKIYLPVDGGTMNTSAALDVLRNHHERIDTTEALKLLPNTTKLNDVEEFLVAVLRERAVARRDAQVLRSLAKVESLQVNKDLLQLHGIKVDITDETLCYVCRKPIKTSAFTFYPNRVMTHLYCSDNRNVCPCTNPKCALQHSPEASKP